MNEVLVSHDHSALHRSPWDTQAMRAEVADLFEARPRIYYLDFLASACTGWLLFGLALGYAPATVEFWALLLLAGFALYRAVSFTHELVHLRKSAVPGFKLVWTALCGMPLMVPNFLYAGVHIAHHSKNKYGTLRDGEYMPFASSAPSLILGHLVGNLILPAFAITRFALLAPLSFLIPPMRPWVIRHLSAMSLRMPFQRELPARAEERAGWVKEELATSAFILLVLAAMGLGLLPWQALLQYAIIVVLIASLNSIRAIGATHRYRSRGQEFSFHHQFQDSVNVASSRLDSLLMCPVGLRYHALHHLFPSLPYHNLGEAHRRLSSTLPREADYHRVRLDSVWDGWRQLLSDIALRPR
ncbi:MAG: fatty acid desaturase [Gammaproteobacteria bacterium]|nr:fatty acid desaturase [Gammaproteobacteria bacterium]